jgi:Trk-type K+ transport system membrane component
MNPIAIRLIIFACVFGAALFGMLFRAILPKQHLSADSKETVRLGIGVIATMTALVLGLLVASAKSFYDTQSSELTQMSANVILLDRVLAHYGSETKEARDLLRGAVARTLDLIWHQDHQQHSQMDSGWR